MNGKLVDLILRFSLNPIILRFIFVALFTWSVSFNCSIILVCVFATFYLSVSNLYEPRLLPSSFQHRIVSSHLCCCHDIAVWDHMGDTCRWGWLMLPKPYLFSFIKRETFPWGFYLLSLHLVNQAQISPSHF